MSIIDVYYFQCHIIICSICNRSVDFYFLESMLDYAKYNIKDGKDRKNRVYYQYLNIAINAENNAFLYKNANIVIFIFVIIVIIKHIIALIYNVILINIIMMKIVFKTN